MMSWQSIGKVSPYEEGCKLVYLICNFRHLPVGRNIGGTMIFPEESVGKAMGICSSTSEIKCKIKQNNIKKNKW